MFSRSVLALAVALAITTSAASQIPTSLPLETLRAIPIQHDGRWPPLDTVARDLVESVTGDSVFRGRDPVAVLLAWTFDSSVWGDEPVIPIRNAELREEFGLAGDQEVYSYNDLITHPTLRPLMDRVRLIEGRKLDPLESKAQDVHDRLITLQRIYSGQVLRAIPHPEDMLGTWRPLPAPTQQVPHELHAVQQAWGSVAEAFQAGDSAAFADASERVTSELAALPAAHRPSPGLIATELRYNRLQPFGTAWKIMALGAALAAAALYVRRRWFDRLAVLALIAGFGVLTYGLSLRWQIAGRIPAANMFESLLFLSWGMGVFAIVALLVQRHRLVPLTASFMGALSLFLAEVLPLDHFVRPIAPVLLDTVWMSIHVPIIMVSYSVLALAVLIAHVQLGVMAFAPGRRRLAELIDGLHYWYVHVGSILLTIGIITGSMWAASSWGRYWGWDPKEVWSLVALLGYMAILHVRVDRSRPAPWMYGLAAILGLALFSLVVPKLAPFSLLKVLGLAGAGAGMAILVLLRGSFATALKSILCFWLIVMTYVGVNFVLGIGLHSYGFGTGAVVRYMFLTGSIDLGLVTLFGLIYLLRRPPPEAVISPPLLVKA